MRMLTPGCLCYDHFPNTIDLEIAVDDSQHALVLYEDSTLLLLSEPGAKLLGEDTLWSHDER